MSNLIDRLNKLHRQHYVCVEDCWYTCPMVVGEDGESLCCSDLNDGEHSECNCGADEFNKELDEIIQLVSSMINHNRKLTAGIEW